MSLDDPLCVYCCDSNRLIDFVREGESAPAAFARLETYATNVEVLPYSEAAKKQEDACRTEPQECTEAEFNYALNVLPPYGWVNGVDAESFKVPEPYMGRIHAIHARLGERYFSFLDDVGMPHADVCAKVFHSAAYRRENELIQQQEVSLERS